MLVRRENEVSGCCNPAVQVCLVKSVLVWGPVHVVVNPEVVEDWIFLGTVSGTYIHMWNIIGVR